MSATCCHAYSLIIPVSYSLDAGLLGFVIREAGGDYKILVGSLENALPFKLGLAGFLEI